MTKREMAEWIIAAKDTDIKHCHICEGCPGYDESGMMSCKDAARKWLEDHKEVKE